MRKKNLQKKCNDQTIDLNTKAHGLHCLLKYIETFIYSNTSFYGYEKNQNKIVCAENSFTLNIKCKIIE